MSLMVLAALIWIGLHLGVAGPMRPRLVRGLGEASYRALFSVLSLVALILLAMAYKQSPYVEIWPTTPGLMLVPVLVMPLSLLLVVAGLRPSNATLAGPDMIMKGELPVQGFTRITRHPMLWGFSLWAIAHMVANGDVATLLLAGSVLVTALNGMVSIDRKRQHKFGEVWQRFTDKTSTIPFVAVLQGRQTFTIRDIGWINIIVSATLYVLILKFHSYLFGVDASNIKLF